MRERPDILEAEAKLHAATAQIGVAEDTHSLRSVVPRTYVLAALGPRPVNDVDHVVWRDAADAIDAYRSRWHVAPGGDALGVGQTAKDNVVQNNDVLQAKLDSPNMIRILDLFRGKTSLSSATDASTTSSVPAETGTVADPTGDPTTVTTTGP